MLRILNMKKTSLFSRWLKFSSRHFSLVGLIILSACGEDTVDVTAQLVYTNDTVKNFVLNGHAEKSIRLLYTNEEVSAASVSAIVQPPSAAPPRTTTTDNKSFYDFAKGGEGLSFVGTGTEVTLRNLPLQKRSTLFALEILHKFSDGTWRPVAYALYKPDNYQPALSGSQLDTDLDAQPITIYAGRTCGRLATPQTFDGTSFPDSLFITSCGS